MVRVDEWLELLDEFVVRIEELELCGDCCRFLPPLVEPLVRGCTLFDIIRRLLCCYKTLLRLNSQNL
jgi:hypothetical protein